MSERFRDLNALAIELTKRGRLSPGNTLSALDGGVSALIGLADSVPPIVVKTARRRLAVDEEWIADPVRSRREGEILALLNGRLGPMRVPRVLFIEPDLNVIGLEAILPIHLTWREDLLQGRADTRVAEELGSAMAALHTLPPSANLADPEGTKLFIELRVEPFYAQTGRQVPDLATQMQRLANDVLHSDHPTLVHGDVTPKNVIASSSDCTLLDFEVIHVGDAAFDPAMLFAHLALKAIYQRTHDRCVAVAGLMNVVWQAYRAGGGPASEDRVVRNMGGIILARLYGKSRVSYLDDSSQKERADRIGRMLLQHPCSVADASLIIQPRSEAR